MSRMIGLRHLCREYIELFYPSKTQPPGAPQKTTPTVPHRVWQTYSLHPEQNRMCTLTYVTLRRNRPFSAPHPRPHESTRQQTSHRAIVSSWDITGTTERPRGERSLTRPRSSTTPGTLGTTKKTDSENSPEPYEDRAKVPRGLQDARSIGGGLSFNAEEQRQ